MKSLRSLPLHLYPPMVSGIRSIRSIRTGMINRTWILGDPPTHVAQIVNAAIDANAEAIIERLHIYLAGSGMMVPRLVSTSDGLRSVPLTDGRRFRVLTWVPGVTRQRPKDISQVRAMAAATGRFHAGLAACSEFLPVARSLLHQTDRYMLELVELTKQDVGELGRLIAYILSSWQTWQDRFRRVAGMLVTGHGDLRTENFRFDAATGKVLRIIDLDTVGMYEFEEELSDALRSWCGRDLDPTLPAKFSVDRFNVALEAYVAEVGSLFQKDLFQKEMARLVPGLERIYLELAARFCLAAVGPIMFRVRGRTLIDQQSRCLRLAQAQVEHAALVRTQREILERIVQQKLRAACG